MINEPTSIKKVSIPSVLSVLPRNDIIVYPFLILPIAVTETRFIKLIDDALSSNKMILLGYTKNNDLKNLANNAIEEYGTVVNILKMLRFPDGSVRILVQGLKRATITKFKASSSNYPLAEIKTINEVQKKTIEEEAMARNLTEMFRKYIKYSQQLPNEIFQILKTVEEPWKLADFISSNLSINIEQKYKILTLINPLGRMKYLADILTKEISILEVGEKIKTMVSTEINDDQKKYFLREQLRAIRKELGEDDPKEKEIDDIIKRMKKKKLSKEAKEVINEQIDKLETMNAMMPEHNVIKTYIEWILDLPWNNYSDDNINIKKAEKILNEDHYDLEKVKTRILEYLAVKQLKKDSKGPILCFVGPPGVGKTSLGKSIARALGRKFIRISLGGIHDEAEIRGHRRTYVGALPGRIIQELKKSEYSNPVFMLDEIDKVGSDFRGDPSSALLEVLDPEQNNSFADHYLEIPYDLSKIMFITTANILYTIPPALRDRMEVIKLPGYTIEDKMNIAKHYLVNRQIVENGLKKIKIKFKDDGIREIIDGYTREAGVRNLERTIGNICRKVAKRVVEGKKGTYTIRKINVKRYLGNRLFLSDKAEKKARIGVATGLAWTAMGGEILFVEALKMPGKGNLILTGYLGDVMKESAKAAMSYIKANYKILGIDIKAFGKYDFHIHLPEGAIPKDGPSAGITLVTALVSVLSEKPVRNDIAMTGEISLRGKVLPIGGLKEKVLGAKLAGINEIILPKLNKRDIDDIPKNILKGMSFHFVSTLKDVLKIAIIR